MRRDRRRGASAVAHPRCDPGSDRTATRSEPDFSRERERPPRARPAACACANYPPSSSWQPSRPVHPRATWCQSSGKCAASRLDGGWVRLVQRTPRGGTATDAAPAAAMPRSLPHPHEVDKLPGAAVVAELVFLAIALAVGLLRSGEALQDIGPAFHPAGKVVVEGHIEVR